MDAKRVELSGQVVREKLDRGSKSERSGVVLRTKEGDRYVLRRNDGPSFGDTTLSSLVGMSIKTDGVAFGDTLVMQNWRRLD